MQTLSEGIRSYPEDPTRFFEFERRGAEAAEYLLLPGAYDYRMLPGLASKKIVHMEFEDPNRFCVADPLFHHIPFEYCFHKVFTICPYTADWLNEQYGNSKRTFVYFPFNARHIPKMQPYLYDIVYSGHIVHPTILRYVREIQQFNYRFISMSQHPAVTNQNVPYVQKLELISQSRITLVQNLLYMNEQQAATAMTIPGMRHNQAFSQAGGPRGPDGEYLAPQLKSRLFEAAFCRSLILCRRDQWNLVERFFEPETEFVYFEEGQLAQKVGEILAHFGDYQPTINRAFARATQNYTTDHFFDRYLMRV